jgi:hypothetical protein
MGLAKGELYLPAMQRERGTTLHLSGEEALSRKSANRVSLSPFSHNFASLRFTTEMAPKSILKKRPAPTEEPTASSAPSHKAVKSKGSIKLAVAAPAPAEESEEEEDESSEDESMDGSDDDSEEEEESDDEETIRALAEGQPRPVKSESLQSL